MSGEALAAVRTHVRVYRRGGYWAVELWRGASDEGADLVEAYVGEVSAALAFARAAAWLDAEPSAARANASAAAWPDAEHAS